MGSFINNLLQNHAMNQVTNNNNNSNNNPNSFFGSGPWDWITNAMTFAGADALMNKYDEEHPDKNHHFLRNAGLAGALALGYQYWKDHHGQNNNNTGQLVSAEQLQQQPTTALVTAAAQPPQQTVGYYYPQQTADYDPIMQLPPMPPMPLQSYIMSQPYSSPMPPYPPFGGDINPYLIQQQNPYIASILMQQQQQQNPYIASILMQQQQQQIPYYGMMGTGQPPVMGPFPPMASPPPPPPPYPYQASFGNNGFAPYYYYPNMF